MMRSQPKVTHQKSQEPLGPPASPLRRQLPLAPGDQRKPPATGRKRPTTESSRGRRVRPRHRHGGLLRHDPLRPAAPSRRRRRLRQARQRRLSGRGGRIRRRAPPRRRAQRLGLCAWRGWRRRHLRHRPPDRLCCAIDCCHGNKIHQDTKDNARWNYCCCQCNCIDILRVQDINWWQQGLYPGECRMSLLQLGSSGVHAVSIWPLNVKTTKSSMLLYQLCFSALYQTRLSLVMTCLSIIELYSYSMDGPQEKKKKSCSVIYC